MTETFIQPDSNIMPVEIRRAVGVLWLSLLLTFIATVIDWRHVSRYGVGFTVFAQIFPMVFWALLIWKIGQGRSWARITWLLLFVGGGLITVLFIVYSRTFRDGVFGSTYSAGLFLIQTAIQVYATVLLFTAKAREWFLRNR
jgi:hypothetical protein